MDRTGLEGPYDFTFNLYDLRETQSNSTDATKAALADAAEASVSIGLNDLGLKLESQRAPWEFIVIDHMERVSTDN